jgi:hypothetical protein
VLQLSCRYLRQACVGLLSPKLLRSVSQGGILLAIEPLADPADLCLRVLLQCFNGLGVGNWSLPSTFTTAPSVPAQPDPPQLLESTPVSTAAGVCLWGSIQQALYFTRQQHRLYGCCKGADAGASVCHGGEYRVCQP